MNKNISLQNSFLRLALGVVSLESVIRPKQILGCDTLNKDLIKLKVLSKAWTFAEISNLKETINFICEEVYNDSTVVERFELVRDLKINDVFIGKTFEDAFREAIKIQLSGDIAGVITEMLGKATINFGGNKNEISERSVGGEPHSQRTTDEKKNSKNKE